MININSIYIKTFCDILLKKDALNKDHLFTQL